MKSAIIFGGAGFIGSFFARHLLDSQYIQKVYLVDIESINSKNSSFREKLIAEDSRILYVKGDVRRSLDRFKYHIYF